MTEETVAVLDIMGPNDPEVRTLISVPELARHWKSTPAFALRRLRQGGVRLVGVRVTTHRKVRLSDIEQLENELTTYILPSGSSRKPPDH